MFLEQPRQLSLDSVADRIAIRRREPMQDKFFNVQVEGGSVEALKR
jgi:hypothetical protein